MQQLTGFDYSYAVQVKNLKSSGRICWLTLVLLLDFGRPTLFPAICLLVNLLPHIYVVVAVKFDCKVNYKSSRISTLCLLGLVMCG